MTISIIHKPRGVKYQARLKEPGGKYHRYTFETQDQAQRWHKQAEAAIRAGEPVPSPEVLQGISSLQSLAALYRDALWPLQATGSVQGQIDRIAECLPPGVSRDVTTITTKSLLEFVENRRAQGVKPATIKHNLSRLQTLLKYAADMGDVPHEVLNSLQWPSVKGSGNRYRFLTPEEEQSLLSALDTQDHKDLAKFLIDTGCRPGEVLDTSAYVAKPFQWQDVSQTPDGRGLITLWETKTGNTRTVPLTSRAKEILDRRRERGERSPFGALSYVSFRSSVLSAAQRCGLQDVVPYTFRHTCATRLVQRGADIRRVQVWMGHSNIETTLRYAKLVPQDIYSLADML